MDHPKHLRCPKPGAATGLAAMLRMRPRGEETFPPFGLVACCECRSSKWSGSLNVPEKASRKAGLFDIVNIRLWVEKGTTMEKPRVDEFTDDLLAA